MTLLEQFIDIAGEQDPITAQNLVRTIGRLMKIANQLKDATGSEKKELIVQFAKKMTDATENPWDDFLPGIIDGLLDAEKGKLGIRKPRIWCPPCISLKTRDLPYRS